MTDETPMHAWLGRMSRRFPAARSEGIGADSHDASVRGDSSHEELETEARTLAEQFRGELASLQLAGVPAPEVAQFRDRFNTFFGRVRTTTDDAELRRVISDLRGLLRDIQDRNRELPSGGLEGDVDLVQELEVEGTPTPASTRTDASEEELRDQLETLAGRAHELYDGLRGRIPPGERDAFRQRHLTLRRIHLRGSSAPEMRRAITDYYDLINDLEARQREADAGGGATPGGRAAGGDGPRPRDLRGLHAQATRRVEQLRALLRDQPTEVENYARQLNSLVPRIRSGDKDELERCAVDLRGFLEDVERRLRGEARRRGAGRGR